MGDWQRVGRTASRGVRTGLLVCFDVLATTGEAGRSCRASRVSPRLSAKPSHASNVVYFHATDHVRTQHLALYVRKRLRESIGRRAAVALVCGGRLACESGFVGRHEIDALVEETVVYDQSLLSGLLVQFSKRPECNRHPMV